jgi:predicted CXXCH cytochrome family protein
MNCRLGAFLLSIALVGFPALGAAEAQDPHSPDNQEACTLCHMEKPRSLEDAERARPLNGETIFNLCTQCHEWVPGRDHRLGKRFVLTSDPPNFLPPDDKGLMDCLTCHWPHRRGTHKAMLRVEHEGLCKACHANK